MTLNLLINEYIYCHLQGDMDRFAVSWVPTSLEIVCGVNGLKGAGDMLTHSS